MFSKNHKPKQTKNDKKQKGNPGKPPPGKPETSNQRQTKRKKSKQQPQQNKTTGFQIRISIPYPPTRRLNKKTRITVTIVEMKYLRAGLQ